MLFTDFLQNRLKNLILSMLNLRMKCAHFFDKGIMIDFWYVVCVKQRGKCGLHRNKAKLVIYVSDF